MQRLPPVPVALCATWTDSTRYGHGRAATRSFYSHHLAEISTAVQLEDANTLNNIAAASTFALAFGVT